MNLNEACNEILAQLSGVISEIKEEDFHKPVASLGNSTIGQHIRHTLEFFTCLMNNHGDGIVNYDKRDHDKVIERDKMVAQAVIDDIITFLSTQLEDKQLVLKANYSVQGATDLTINTYLFRELAYNIEHAIHHMAIIKIGIKAVAPYITIPDHFGVAVSTIRYQENQVAS